MMFATNAYSEILPGDRELLVRIHGEIDHHSAKSLREKTDMALCRHRPSLLILDLGEVTFMDSSGLGFVLGRLDRAEALGCRVEVQRARERIRRILLMAGLGRMKNIVICESEATEKN